MDSMTYNRHTLIDTSTPETMLRDGSDHAAGAHGSSYQGTG